jgi:hypothetical protein
MNEDPSDHDPGNLAVLCFDCHRDTQLRGGFDRKLDSDQVRLYRDDWTIIVRRDRATHAADDNLVRRSTDHQFELATSVAEIYRENQEYELLAMHYDVIGNTELRDKYVELVLSQDSDDQTIVYLRQLQGRHDLIPPDVIQREADRYTKNKDWSQRARFFEGVGRSTEAVLDYLRSISESIEEGNAFSAAFYLKELQKTDLLKDLFVLAFKKAESEGELWWQVRALQELEWDSELRELLIANESEIDNSENPMLQAMLARAKGDIDRYSELQKLMASKTRSSTYGVATDFNSA